MCPSYTPVIDYIIFGRSSLTEVGSAKEQPIGIALIAYESITI